MQCIKEHIQINVCQSPPSKFEEGGWPFMCRGMCYRIQTGESFSLELHGLSECLHATLGPVCGFRKLEPKALKITESHNPKHGIFNGGTRSTSNRAVLMNIGRVVNGNLPGICTHLQWVFVGTCWCLRVFAGICTKGRTLACGVCCEGLLFFP